MSERFWQLEGTGQWIKGKSAETFGPLGPWLVTADEIGDPQNLDMWLDVNGQRMQTGNTKHHDLSGGAADRVPFEHAWCWSRATW